MLRPAGAEADLELAERPGCAAEHRLLTVLLPIRQRLLRLPDLRLGPRQYPVQPVAQRSRCNDRLWIKSSSRQAMDGKVGPAAGQAGGCPPSSYAPISQAAIPSPLPSSGRERPRWSVAGGGQSFPPASIAGLPGESARVGVDPPLSCSGPSCGSTSARSPGSANPQVLPLS